ncbi:hypothetical protein RRG08_019927 [Elysia crispata]|uniref:Uncharacterized protein n=1 Tax=Elysia crispata TaxID=231223 RepID=A0AAE1EBM0_9GAST|nr:hypothetical protein RRG08_019927 [Elysia crispata]
MIDVIVITIIAQIVTMIDVIVITIIAQIVTMIDVIVITIIAQIVTMIDVIVITIIAQIVTMIAGGNENNILTSISTDFHRASFNLYRYLEDYKMAELWLKQSSYRDTF